MGVHLADGSEKGNSQALEGEIIMTWMTRSRDGDTGESIVKHLSTANQIYTVENPARWNTHFLSNPNLPCQGPRFGIHLIRKKNFNGDDCGWGQGISPGNRRIRVSPVCKLLLATGRMWNHIKLAGVLTIASITSYYLLKPAPFQTLCFEINPKVA